MRMIRTFATAVSALALASGLLTPAHAIASSNPIHITVLTWRDTDFVAYSENPDIGKLKAGCFVRYRPLAEANQPGA